MYISLHKTDRHVDFTSQDTQSCISPCRKQADMLISPHKTHKHVYLPAENRHVDFTSQDTQACISPCRKQTCWFHLTRHTSMYISLQKTGRHVDFTSQDTQACISPCRKQTDMLISPHKTHKHVYLPAENRHVDFTSQDTQACISPCRKQADMLISPHKTHKHAYLPAENRHVDFTSQDTQACISPCRKQAGILISPHKTHKHVFKQAENRQAQTQEDLQGCRLSAKTGWQLSLTADSVHWFKCFYRRQKCKFLCKRCSCSTCAIKEWSAGEETLVRISKTEQKRWASLQSLLGNLQICIARPTAWKGTTVGVWGKFFFVTIHSRSEMEVCNAVLGYQVVLYIQLRLWALIGGPFIRPTACHWASLVCPLVVKDVLAPHFL